MSSLLIRPASTKDAPSIEKVRFGAFTEDEAAGYTIQGGGAYYLSGNLLKEWEGENRLRGGFEVFLAEREGRVVGFIVYAMESRDDNIDNVVVAKDEQGRGVGRALVEYVERLARSRGYGEIRTDTTENAEGVPWKAYGFWRRMGYEDTGERTATGYGFRDIHLVKKL